MPSLIKSFSFNPNAYPELAHWLISLEQERGRISREVTQILHAHITSNRATQPTLALIDGKDGHDGVSPTTVALRDIQARLDRIEARLQGGVVASSSAETTSDSTADLPEDVPANLDKLAL